MSDNFYLNPATVKAECFEAIRLLKKNNQNVKQCFAVVKQYCNDYSISSTAFKKNKKQLGDDYKLVCNAIISANKTDIKDFRRLISYVGDRILDGSKISKQLNDAKKKLGEYEDKAQKYSDASAAAIDPVTRDYNSSQKNKYNALKAVKKAQIALLKRDQELYYQIENNTSGLFLSTASVRELINRGIKSISSCFVDGVYQPDLNDSWRDELEKALSNMKDESAKAGKQLYVQMIGDPINTANGNLYYTYSDLTIPGVEEFCFSRTYNSVTGYSGVLGKNWNHNYELHIELIDNSAILMCEDGRVVEYERIDDGFSSGDDTDDRLISIPQGFKLISKEFAYLFDNEGRYARRENNNGIGFSLSYDNDGHLSEVQKDSGEYFRFEYDCTNDGQYKLKRVSDHAGRSVEFVVSFDKLKKVTINNERVYRYKYGTGEKLEEIINPRGISIIRNEYLDKSGVICGQRFSDGSYLSISYPKDEPFVTVFTERNSSVKRFRHDTNLRLIEDVNDDGFEAYEYNENGLRISKTDRKGNRTEYRYDSVGNIVSVKNPDDSITEYEYDEQNMPVRIMENGVVIEVNTYDDKSNLLKSEDALGNATEYEYDSEGLVSRIILPNGFGRSIKRDRRGNIIALTDEGGATYESEYDDLNRIVSETDPNGNTTRYTYDSFNNIISIQNAAGDSCTYKYNEIGKPIAFIDYDGSTTQFDYNNIGKLERITDAQGNITEFKYDSMWNVSEVVMPDGGTYFNRFDDQNRLVEAVTPNGGVTHLDYSPDNQISHITNPLGNATHFKYDSMGRNIETISPAGYKSEFRYDPFGNNSMVVDPNGTTTEFIYDQANRLIESKNADGDSRFYKYTPDGLIDSITDEAGRIERYSYTPTGNVSHIEHFDGTEESFEYDGCGNMISHTIPQGYVVRYSYDCLNRLVEEFGDDGHSNKFIYDKVGNLIETKDSAGNVTKYDYTATRNLCGIIDSLGNKTDYSYDECSRLISVTQYNGTVPMTTEYSYDAEGNVTEVRDPFGNCEKFKYDKVNRLIEKEDQDGYVTRYSYNSEGNLSQIVFNDGRSVKYEYDANQNISNMTDWNGTLHTEYDKFGRATSITDFMNRTTRYSYGKLGECTSITYPSGYNVLYGYDELNRLVTLQYGNESVEYSYDSYGNPARKSYSSGIVAERSYDKLGRLLKIENRDRNGILDSMKYSYDLMGNKIAIRRNRKGLPDDAGLWEYGYDSLGRIISAALNGNIIRTYEYDARGNRTRMTDGDSATDYFYDAAGRLNKSVEELMDGKTKATSYKYDRRGNLVETNCEDEVIRFRYDETGRLKNSSNSDGRNAEYSYDGLGNRIGMNYRIGDDNHEIQYSNDYTKTCCNLIEDTSFINGEKSVKHSYSRDWGLVGMTNSNGDYAYVLDDMNSPIRTISEHGSETYTYDEFGNMAKMPGIQPFGYTGYRAEPVSDMFFAQAREYTPSTGRFAGQDIIRGSIELPHTLNRYGYCWNNPMQYIDPNGETPMKIGIRLGDEFLADSSLETINTITLEYAKGINNSSHRRELKEIAKRLGRAGIKKRQKLFKETIKVNKFHGKVDGVLNFTDKIAVPVITGGIDVGYGVYQNVQKGVRRDRVVSDAIVDTADFMAGWGVAVAAGLFIAGPAGVIIGIGAGIVYQFITDCVTVNGKTIDERTKEYVDTMFECIE